ncbi:acetyl-CoA C-acetyltransferase [Raineyella fluvialis]|uniref:Acetyl-CoA C-acetyltransferase n=1 Tax=Raineyella fluvialis TaxID=2662261 RepID=A0A5Q2FCX6_9ACTN|nr:acetyl-CoA C-acetyltransferase [Raineyella fluvialis]QGF22555.1 acetyl-CoA C-acetyltransferase [Raineyella fluvialis]
MSSEHAESTQSTGARERTAVVVGGNRMPFAKARGSYAADSTQDLLTAALDGLVARFGLAGQRLGEVAAGAVLKHGTLLNLTREAVLSSALAPDTPAVDLQQACGTGLEATIYISNKIRLGQIDSGIAGGADSISDTPLEVSPRLQRALLRFNSAKSPQAKLAALADLRLNDLAPIPPLIAEPRTGLSMGESQAVTTAKWGISRAAQDEYALGSHRKLAAAWESGFFDDLVTPRRGVTRDESLRPDTSLEKLAALPTVFGGPGATMTAGNSSPLNDGAAVVLLAEEQWARERRLPVLARIVDAEVASVDYASGKEGLLMAPVHAVPRLLARQGMALQDFDLYEIHEAFAATVLVTLAAWADDDYCRRTLGLPGAFGTIDPEKLNVTGSSLAAGHPFAATGGRIVATLAKLLAARGPGARGLISICAAGGQGVAAILEAM